MNIHSVFDKIAERYPENVAAVGSRTELSYSELRSMSDALASFLLTKAASDIGAIGLRIENDPLSLVAILGILKSDSRVIFIDLTFSDALVDKICKENGVRLVFTVNDRSRRSVPPGVRFFDLDLELCWRSACASAAQFGVNVDSDSVALVGYTSGTTGEPKGVAVSHRACLFAYRKFWEEIPDDVEADRFGYVTYFAWDALSPLVCGKTGVFVDGALDGDIIALTASLRHQRVNHLFLTPSLLANLLSYIKSAPPEAALDHLKVIWLGGEVLSTKILHAAMDVLPNVVFLSNYGPTECFVVTQGRLHRRQEGHVASAGRVLPELQIRFLDEGGQDITTEGLGYLCVAGPALANGYIARPHLEATRFKQIDGETYFFTGDYCAFGEDGELRVIGRSEFMGGSADPLALSSLEGALLEHPLVDACKVVKNPGTPGGVLVFIVPHVSLSEQNTLPTLTEFVCSLYPNARCVLLDEIPLHRTSRKANYARLFDVASSQPIE
ncbi:MAG: long-chain fatty acid--CoA ligase, partial [Rhodocyclaceae bacterium]|nr:long-chain fatty acid--CoA ligase [Rhodocyclaceae bacterium]